MRTKEIAGIIIGLKGDSELANEVSEQLQLSDNYYIPTNYSAKSVI
jgi:hypothetical protein